MDSSDQIEVTFDELTKLNIDMLRVAGSAKRELFHPNSLLSIRYIDDSVMISVTSPKEYVTSFDLRLSAIDGKLNKFYVRRIHQGGDAEEYELKPSDINYPVTYLQELRKLRDQHISNKERGVLEW